MKKLIRMSFIVASFVMVAWILFYFIGRSCVYTTNKEELNVAYVSLGALFTALAFGGTILSIIYQRQTTLRATSLEVFTRVYNAMQIESKFTAALNYILFQYTNDLQTKKNTDLKAEIMDGTQISKYKSIEYFCERMDYIGILISQEYVDIVLLYPTGGEYTKAFNILNEYFFTEINRKRYLHFRYLIYLMNKHNNKYLKYTRKIEEKLSIPQEQPCDNCVNYKKKESTTP